MRLIIIFFLIVGSVSWAEEKPLLTYRLLDGLAVYRVSKTWGVKHRSTGERTQSIEFLIPTPIHDNTGAGSLQIRCWTPGNLPELRKDDFNTDAYEKKRYRGLTNVKKAELRYGDKQVIYAHTYTPARSATLIHYERYWHTAKGTVWVYYSIPIIDPGGEWFRQTMKQFHEIERLASIGGARLPPIDLKRNENGELLLQKSDRLLALRRGIALRF